MPLAVLSKPNRGLLRGSDGIYVSINLGPEDISPLFKEFSGLSKRPVGLQCDHIGPCRNG